MKLQTKIFTEIGYGNASFVSTEIEIGEKERRVLGFVPMKLVAVYFRLWIGKTVYLLSTNDGFETIKKSKNRFKVLVGFSGKRK